VYTISLKFKLTGHFAGAILCQPRRHTQGFNDNRGLIGDISFLSVKIYAFHLAGPPGLFEARARGEPRRFSALFNARKL
jgi:hypothetical protein